MVRLRLRRVGRKGRPFYRIVVADARSPRDGRFIEVIGHYDPLKQPAAVVIKEERALLWLGRGARPSDTVSRLLERAGIQLPQSKAAQAPPAPAQPQPPGEES